ncbi:MAG: hypothetical protein IKN06_13650 [Bacteroidales bacterium]|nr:hypothetical protein [Bacteroidales bacterium]
MKKTGLMISLVLLTGCAIQEIDLGEAPSTGPYTVQFRAMEVETRTAFGTPDGMSFPTLWTDNDAKVLISVNNEPTQEAEVIPSQDYKTALFSATFDEHDSYTFFALSPSTASTGMSPSRKSWKVTIPSEQTPLATSCDERAQIMAAKTPELPFAPEKLDLSFRHVTAYMSVTLTGLPSGTEVSSVELTTGVPLVGDFYYDCEGEMLTDNGASSTVTLSTDASGPVWVACAPVDLSGQPMTVTVHTAAGNYVKKVTFPEDRKLTPAMVALFSVNMSGIEPESTSTEEYYELVTDASTLRDGDEVIIASPQYGYAMSTTQNSNNRGRAAVTIEDNKIVVPSSSVQIVTLESAGSGVWYLQVSDGQYLYTTSSTNNSKQYLRTGSKTQSSVFNQWAVSISNGNASISAKVNNTTTKYLKYNNSSSVFDVATSSPGTGNNRVSLYRKVTPASFEGDPILDYEEYGAYLAANTWVYIPATDHLSREYGTDDLSFAILSPFKNAIMEFQGIPLSLYKGARFTLTFNRQEDAVVSGHGSFEVMVVKESGRKVWLSDGMGNGFIIKK